LSMNAISSLGNFIRVGFDTPKLASAWLALVRGAHASRVLHPASRRVRFGWLGRDAQAGTRDACAPRSTNIGFSNVPELVPGIFTTDASQSTL
jgi:hypothetical protein